MTQIPDKNVVLFDITGAWCPYCPDGVATIHDIQTAHPDVIAVAVHVGDVMAITEGEDLVNPYVSGYPSGMVDVYKPGEEAVATSSRGAWQGRVENRMQTIVPVKITIPSSGWNAATRTIDVTVNAEFFAPMSGDLRLNAYIIEDEVTGGSQYDQANYYNNSPGHMFFGAGNPIVGFEHDHTLRAMLGGTWGQSGAVPGTVAAGAQHSYTFSYVLPAGHDETKIKLIGLIQRYDADENNREIYNATEKELKLWSTGIGSDEFAGDLEIYPNPASDFVNIVLNLEESRDLNIRVTDMFGRELTQIASETLPAGEHAFQWNGTTASGSFVANGFYFIEVRSDEGVSTRKVLLAR
jgi:thiol-disulfide isomerase/thioredoxin